MRPLLIMKIVMIAKFCLLTNILLCQESLLKNQFELSTTLATTRSGEPMITFKIANNSLDSIKVEPPEVGSSVIVYVLPNKEELESSIILCGPDVDFSVWLFPKQVQSFNIPIKQCQIMLNPYQKKIWEGCYLPDLLEIIRW